MSADYNVIYFLVVSSAVLHSLWNALIKKQGDTLLNASSVVMGAFLIATISLPFLKFPAPASWPFIVVSAVIQIAYILLLARIYSVTEMSASYPIMRGGAPLLVALFSIIFLHEALGLATISGIIFICAGVLLTSSVLARNRAPSKAGKLILLNTLVIATYTLIDGNGVRLSGSPISYTLCIFFLQGVGFILVDKRVLRRGFLKHSASNWKISLVAGICTITAYGVTLWAMSLAPIAIIAALRETSILFGVLVSWLMLHEKINSSRLTGAGLILAGAIILHVV